MSELRVHPPGLTGYGDLLGRASGDAQACRSHVDQWVPVIDMVSGGIINPLTYEHIGVRERITVMLTKAVAVLEISQQSLNAAAKVYRDTDQRAAVEIDGMYPEVQRPIAGVV
jgi:hypothetical protein